MIVIDYSVAYCEIGENAQLFNNCNNNISKGWMQKMKC